MSIPNILTKRPIITLTVLYVFLLIFLDYTGFFSLQKRSRLALLAGENEISISGIIVSEPEKRNGNISFIVRASQASGKKLSEKLYVRTAENSTEFIPGNILNINGKIRVPYSPKNPGGFDYSKYLSRQNIFTEIYPFKIEITGFKKPPPIYLVSETIRKDIIRTFLRYLPLKSSSVLLPMVIGDKTYLAKETKDEFLDAGVMHVLVVSGLNVGYVSVIFICFFRLIGLSLRKSAFSTLPFILLYAFMTGANPPIVRATVMAIFVIISVSLAREPLVYQSLFLGALTILLFDPQSLFTASFQLSFAATIGIVFFYPYIMLPFKKLPFWLKNTLGSVCAVSLSAQIAVLPLLAYYFNKISIAGLLTNIIIVPLAGLATAAGILLYIIHFAGDTLSSIAAYFNNVLITVINFTVSYFSKLKYAVTYVPTPPAEIILAYYIFIAGAFRIWKYRKLGLLGIFATLVLSLNFMFTRYKENNSLQINFIDAPYSNSAHVRFPHGINYLFGTGSVSKGGNNPGSKIFIPYFRAKGINSIKKIFIPKANRREYESLIPLLEYCKIKEIFYGPSHNYDDHFLNFIQLLKDKDIEIKETWEGDSFSEGGSTITVISPQLLSGKDTDNSLAVVISYKKWRILLTCGLGDTALRNLLNSGIGLNAAILQIPVNASKELIESLIKKCQPKVIISYSHRDDLKGYQVYCLRETGCVSVFLDEKKMFIKEFSD